MDIYKMNEASPAKSASNNSKSVFRSMLKSYPDVLNITQMCEALGGLSTKTGYKLLNEHRIPSVKVGRSYRILKVSIIQYLTDSHK
jgi:DNA binding domain, excisionase family